MNGPLKEWIEKAEEDYRAAVRMVRYRRDPTPTTVCFHCQQCIEKYMKGCLIRLDLSFPRTHDLEALLNLLAKSLPSLNALQVDAVLLNDFSVTPRYPGIVGGPDNVNAFVPSFDSPLPVVSVSPPRAGRLSTRTTNW